jgi:ATP-dependent Clp protease ATP-binding subunit ClpA
MRAAQTAAIPPAARGCADTEETLTMFERFTDRARTAMILARAKATERGDQIRPVYMLHALVTGEGVAARVLGSLGVDADAVERQLARTAPLGNPLEGEAASGDAEALASIGIDLDEIKHKVEESFGPGALERAPLTPQGPLNWTGRMSLTRESRQMLGLALKEARALRHNYIGTEHLLLALLTVAERNPRGDFTLDTLRDLGIDPEQVRQRVLDVLRHASA